MNTGKNANYFPHDSNAANDPKIMIMIAQLGIEAYGLYWIIIELLRDQPEYKAPLALLDPLGRRFGVSREKMETIITRYDLFSYNETEFTSPSLSRRMEPLELRREQMKRASDKRWKNIPDNEGVNAYALPMHSISNPKKSIVENSIEEKSKENIKKEDPEKIPDDPIFFNNDILKLFEWIMAGRLPGSREPVFPARFLPNTAKRKKTWIDCLNKLHTLDAFTMQEINGAIIFARQDSFWKDNFLSIMKLRDRDKDGVRYIDRFVNEWEKKYKNRKKQ